MRGDDVRRLAPALPGAVESAHMGRPDVHVGGTIFATIGAPDAGHATLKLSPGQQERDLALHAWCAAWAGVAPERPRGAAAPGE